MKKLVAPILFSLLISIITISTVTLWENISLVWKNDYSESDVFQENVNHFIDELISSTLTIPDKDLLVENFSPSQEQIREYRYRYGDLNAQLANVKEQYENQIAIATEEKEEDTKQLLVEERDKKLKAIKENFSSDDVVIEKMKNELSLEIDKITKEKEYRRKDLLNQYPYFIYEFKEIDTGRVFSNGTKSGELYYQKLYGSTKNTTYPLLLVNPNDYYWMEWAQNENDYYNLENTRKFEGSISISHSMMKDNLLPYYEEFRQSKTYFILLSITLFTSIIALLILVKKFGRHELLYPIKTSGVFNKLDVKFLIFWLFAYLFFFNAFYPLELLWLTPRSISEKVLYSSLGLFFALPIFRNIVEDTKHNFDRKVKDTYVYTLFYSLRSLPLWSLVEIKVFIVLFVFTCWGFGTALLLAQSYGGEAFVVYLLCMAFILLPTTIWVLYQLGVLRKLTKQTGVIIQQGVKDPIPLKGTKLIKELTRNINELQNGIQTSKANEQKSERLKTELISNVSHDLRTPLTAIITYTDLLKKGEGTEEEKANYISILDRKSLRLKKLLDDLFEVTKMSSGNVELQRERVDLKQLIQQAVAEQEHAIKDANLELRVSLPLAETFAYVDGQKIWRLVDNLLINATKYALGNTRVYVKATVERQEFILTMKNVSSHELGENIDELVQRFKRGDTSRHTEGSGLGLAIAQSIAELHDGSLDVTLDGDLFTVTVRLPL
ncbi:histidine kinase dimerization/phospho-acceptor domain-containing protein [Mangrovibacillus cuniculi]|uniref:histidine kinase n=1 Tax=Mangrovibacillus cuniculi TaxID=2593652 RepID=A0A7S8CAI7_9BACI|nr:histidine kinase dimerization/phospho-acceptor domain-containing protein [Mangrovibacillus cuniculi]QPC46426.1 GHKL domain-containing protein [Mangrovibacillus cuniculi]